MLHPNTKHIKYFLFSQHLADGIRITLEIITPVFIFSETGQMSIGLTIALGALCVSICDMPGPVDHKRNGMLYCNLSIFIMCLLTGLVSGHIFLTGLLIAASAFFFTIFSVYGIRAGGVGTAALLVMILRLPDTVTAQVALTDSILVLAGGIWYMLIALLFYRLRPYRPAQRALGNCIHETAKFLRIKSALYDPRADLEEEYRKLLTQQVVVNEKQDVVRELLFKNKALLQEPSKTSRVLILAFADAVDLFEQITATWYDYRQLRERFESTGVLTHVSEIIKGLSIELDNIGLAIQANSTYKKQYALIPALDSLKTTIDKTNDTNAANLVLKKILVNLRNLGRHIDELMNYFSVNVSSDRVIRSKTDYSRFVSHQEINPVILRNNMNLGSGVFRHALRMMITCIAGFVIAKLISNGHHSYWILLTIIILLKPGFSLTKERNIQRFAGTIAGGLIGLTLLHFIRDRNILFGLIIFFMIGTYSFQRLNYIVMVIFTTPYVLILLNVMGLGFLDVAKERLLDTGIACVLSFLASYILFPHWESQHLYKYMQDVLKANIAYLEKLKDLFKGKKVSTIDYKLARKDVYTATSNLAAAFNRMLSEPKSKQTNGDLIYEFVVLNHVLSSNVASLATSLLRNEQQFDLPELAPLLKRSVTILEECLQQLERPNVDTEKKPQLQMKFVKDLSLDKQLSGQVNFILNVSGDIKKLAGRLAR